MREPKDPAPTSSFGGVTPVIAKIDGILKLEIGIRLLKDVHGTVLEADVNCPFDAEKLDELPHDQKGSMFWVEYTDH